MKRSLTTAAYIIVLFLQATPTIACDIGLISFSNGHFWEEIEKGALQASKELNISLYHRAAFNEKNNHRQEQIIHEGVIKGCQGFVIAPSSSAINTITSYLKMQKIPTVYIDRDYGGDRLSIISTHNYLAGVLAGEQMVKALKGKGNVILFRQSSNIISTHHRAEGFLAAVTAGGLTVVLDKNIGSTIGDARANSLNHLETMKDVAGIFTPNETTTMGVLINLQSLRKTGEAVHIGFDAHQKILDAIQTNDMYATIIQNPFQMGYQGVKNVHSAMKGHEIKSAIDIAVSFVNKDNIDTADIKKLLSL